MPRAFAPAANLPRITVATICWNAAGTIRDTLESLKAQNYPNLEYLVIDGGSKDATLNIVREYADLNPVIDPGPDEGPNHAYQKAIDQASGDLFGLLNADDILEPGALHAVAQAWLKNPVDMVTLPSKIAQVNPDKSLKITYRPPLSRLNPVLENFAKGSIYPNARFCRPALLRRERIRYKLPDGRKCTAADLDLFLRLSRKPFENITLDANAPAYIYRTHEGSLTFNTNPVKMVALLKETIFIHQRFIREYGHTLTARQWLLVLIMQLRFFRLYILRSIDAFKYKRSAR